jgi:6-pyruvoyltetrahydropterin/6-carboxytetrahydropterin synthase
MFEISIKGQFCGAHRLNGYAGPCANMHGHNWEVEAYFRGNRLNRLGMLVDFRTIKALLHQILAQMDHHDLNLLPPFKKTNPTSENIAKFIFTELARSDGGNCRLHRVRVSESPGSTATYYGKKSPRL